jgi:hypothetical protein
MRRAVSSANVGLPTVVTRPHPCTDLATPRVCAGVGCTVPNLPWSGDVDHTSISGTLTSMTTPTGPDDDPREVRHFCGRAERHHPHIGCNGFGFFAGAPEDLCATTHRHPPHTSCDGLGRP